MNVRLQILNSAEAHPDLRFSSAHLSCLEGAQATSLQELYALGDTDILLVNTKVDIAALKRSKPSLKWVQVISAGVEAYLPSLPEDVALTNASGVHSEKGAEFVLASVLMLNYQIPRFLQAQKNHVWQQDFVRPLAGKHALVLGAGAIGAAAIKLLQGRGMTVSTLTRSGQSSLTGLEAVAKIEALHEFLPKADFLICTLPLTFETKGLVGEKELALLPMGAGIVNVSRAAVFDESALEASLKAGRLCGLVTDVFHREPLTADDVAWDWPLTIATPHCSVDDHEGYLERCLEVFTQNLDRFTRGAALLNRVDKSRGY